MVNVVMWCRRRRSLLATHAQPIQRRERIPTPTQNLAWTGLILVTPAARGHFHRVWFLPAETMFEQAGDWKRHGVRDSTSGAEETSRTTTSPVGYQASSAWNLTRVCLSDLRCALVAVNLFEPFWPNSNIDPLFSAASNRGHFDPYFQPHHLFRSKIRWNALQ